MNAPTVTVVSGYTDRDGRHWVFVRNNPNKLLSDEPLPEGTAVRVVGGRVERAN